jgi:hypothetical protein
MPSIIRRRIMRKRLIIGLVLILVLIPTGMAQAKKPIRGTTDYYFMGHLEIIDPAKGLLAWEGTISGDINGSIRWWIPVLYETGQVTHFEDTRWEIWDGDTLLLAGEESGTTTDRPGLNGIWRANGTVTEAYGDYEYLVGRQVHDGGEFTWAPFPWHGWGEFRIN